MFKIKITLFILLSFYLNSIPAQIDPLIIIDPAYPQVGDTIKIGILPSNCQPMPFENSQGLTHLFTHIENNIVLYAIAEILPLPGGVVCFQYPRTYYDLGQLNEGSYSLAVQILSQNFNFPIPVNYDPRPPYGTLIFNVSGAPKIIDANTNIGLWTLIILLLFVYYIRFKRELQ